MSADDPLGQPTVILPRQQDVEYGELTDSGCWCCCCIWCGWLGGLPAAVFSTVVTRYDRLLCRMLAMHKPPSQPLQQS